MTSKGRTIVTDLFSVTRLTNSRNGNPRFDLHTSDGTFRTQSDAACSYDVDNIARTIPRGETIPVTLSTTPAGRVWNVERVSPTYSLSEVRNGTGWRHGTYFRQVGTDHTYSLPEVRNGTGWRRGVKFTVNA